MLDKNQLRSNIDKDLRSQQRTPHILYVDLIGIYITYNKTQYI